MALNAYVDSGINVSHEGDSLLPYYNGTVEAPTAKEFLFLNPPYEATLTKHPEGSVRELWTISFPLILAFLSGYAMNFADRLFLAHYSIEAMNAAAAASMVVFVFQFGSATITSITEVFVGQLNGAREHKNIASLTWQMLWFSASLILPFLALAHFGGPYLLSEYHYTDHGLPYFQWLLYFVSASPAIYALSSFYTGIGQTRLILGVSILGNLINIILDPILIFGVEGIIAPMGTSGAAIATGASLLTQLICLLSIFLSRHYSRLYNTWNCRLHAGFFFRCIRIGVPSAAGIMIEWTVWALSLRIADCAGEQYLTVATIGQSLYMLFGVEGLQEGVMTLTANRIGANKYNGISSILASALKLFILISIPFGILLLGFPELIIDQFLSSEISPPDVLTLLPMLQLTASGVFLYFLFDGFNWICNEMLTAAEDTWFLMCVRGTTAICCALTPLMLVLVIFKASPVWYPFILCFYSASNASILLGRMWWKGWLPLSWIQMSKERLLRSALSR